MQPITFTFNVAVLAALVYFYYNYGLTYGVWVVNFIAPRGSETTRVLLLYAALAAPAYLVYGVGNPLLKRLLSGTGRGGGVWSTNFMRRLIGMTANALLTICGTIVLGFIAIGSAQYLHRFFNIPPSGNGYLVVSLVIGAPAFYLIFEVGVPWIKIGLGKGTRPLRRFWRSRHTGMGGSAKFAGLLEEWANPWKPGQILLGASIYDPEWKVGVPDDRHFMTIATSRSGKGRSAIIPNLLTWPGSALVIDPKGQNAAVTAAYRGKGGGRIRKPMGQPVYVVDPFHETAGQDAMPQPSRFNPLAELDPDSREIVEQISLVADALIIPAKSGDPFWTESAQALIAGVVAHVITTLPPEKRTLGNVRDTLKIPMRELVEFMKSNKRAGGLPHQAAALLESSGDRAGGNIISTALSNTAWLDSIAMRDCLSTSDFKLRELKDKPATVYMVLPPNYVDYHARFLRLFINLSLKEFGQGTKARHGILFIMDEFYSLGPMPILAKAAGLVAGYGVKLWPIVQNLTQLRDLYPDNWETFLGNAGQTQVFAVNDETTARYVSGRLGNHVLWRKVKSADPETGFVTEEWVPSSIAPLRDVQEVGRATSRDSGNQLVFSEGADTFLLRRMPYDKAFRKSRYMPDPMEKKGAAPKVRPEPAVESGEIVPVFTPPPPPPEPPPRPKPRRKAKEPQEKQPEKPVEMDRD